MKFNNLRIWNKLQKETGELLTDIPKPKTINEYWEEYRSATNNDDAWSFKEWLRIKLEVEGKFTIVSFTPIEVTSNKSEIDSSYPF
jgi:hypothetical protein